jgi:hypothetical protein
MVAYLSGLFLESEDLIDTFLKIFLYLI